MDFNQNIHFFFLPGCAKPPPFNFKMVLYTFNIFGHTVFYIIQNSYSKRVNIQQKRKEKCIQEFTSFITDEINLVSYFHVKK